MADYRCASCETCTGYMLKEYAEEEGWTEDEYGDRFCPSCSAHIERLAVLQDLRDENTALRKRNAELEQTLHAYAAISAGFKTLLETDKALREKHNRSETS